jgi:micrococcal nuclease
MPSPSRRLAAAFALVLVVSTTACTLIGESPGTGGGRSSASVVRVVDGDTIRVDLDGREVPVRLIGIDTPEVTGPHTDEECYGADASRFVARALEGRAVALEFDIERTDRFDRTLAYVWLDGELFNERLVLDGFAIVTTFPPTVRSVDRFTRAQRHAREAGAGLWSACLAP